jgi:ArsR family transcriptional regulator
MRRCRTVAGGGCACRRATRGVDDLNEGLDNANHFHIIGNVETKDAVQALAALAQETRLAVFRLLVEAGPEGIAAGEIASELDLPPATLSFHLAQLANAGLVRARQEGRFIYYAPDFTAMNGLLGFLTENCCARGKCEPQQSTIQIVRKGTRR